jgi:hypothetical protein
MLTDLSSHPAGIYAEGDQPRPLRGPALCAALRQASRMMADPSTPPGAVAELLSHDAPIPPGMSGLRQQPH